MDDRPGEVGARTDPSRWSIVLDILRMIGFGLFVIGFVLGALGVFPLVYWLAACLIYAVVGTIVVLALFGFGLIVDQAEKRYRRCPACQSIVRRDASICRNCQHELA